MKNSTRNSTAWIRNSVKRQRLKKKSNGNLGNENLMN
jgi:hypothetical protein